MKFLRIFVLSAVFFITVSIIYISSVTAENKTVIRLATLGQKGVSVMTYLDETFLPVIEKVTNGEVVFDVYWGGVMGDEEDYIEKMRVNQLQGAMVTASGGITGAICPDIAVFKLPFLFNPWAWDEVKYVRDNLKNELYSMSEKKGYKILTWIDLDFEQLYSTKYKIDTLENLQKSKVLTHAGRLEDLMLRSLGISPVPVNVPEVVSSVRTGIINVAISPSLWWVGAQLYTDTKYVNPLPIKYAPSVIILSMDAWNKLSEQNRQAITKVLPMLEEKANAAMRDCNKKAYNAMLKYGVKEIHLSKRELSLFKDKTRPLWDEMAGDIYSKEILEKVLNLLKEYRMQKKDLVSYSFN